MTYAIINDTIDTEVASAYGNNLLTLESNPKKLPKLFCVDLLKTSSLLTCYQKLCLQIPERMPPLIKSLLFE